MAIRQVNSTAKVINFKKEGEKKSKEQIQKMIYKTFQPLRKYITKDITIKRHGEDIHGTLKCTQKLGKETANFYLVGKDKTFHILNKNDIPIILDSIKPEEQIEKVKNGGTVAAAEITVPEESAIQETKERKEKITNEEEETIEVHPSLLRDTPKDGMAILNIKEKNQTGYIKKEGDFFYFYPYNQSLKENINHQSNSADPRFSGNIKEKKEKKTINIKDYGITKDKTQNIKHRIKLVQKTTSTIEKKLNEEEKARLQSIELRRQKKIKMMKIMEKENIKPDETIIKTKEGSIGKIMYNPGKNNYVLVPINIDKETFKTTMGLNKYKEITKEIQRATPKEITAETQRTETIEKTLKDQKKTIKNRSEGLENSRFMKLSINEFIAAYQEQESKLNKIKHRYKKKKPRPRLPPQIKQRRIKNELFKEENRIIVKEKNRRKKISQILNPYKRNYELAKLMIEKEKEKNKN